MAEKKKEKKKEINKSTNDDHVTNLKHSTEKIHMVGHWTMINESVHT